jgi:predicted Zn-dependent peptidase
MEIINRSYANGLRSLSVISKDAASVTIMFLVKVGSRYEVAGEEGLAHFVEHTIFKGTSKRPSSKAISMEMESLGGSTNAFTSYDYTGYYIKAPSEHFEQNFEILSDMFNNSLFASEEIAKERGVIIEEIRMYEDRPTSKVSQDWLQNFFQENPLAREITGTIDSVSAMQREQFQGFLQKHYYAENILVVVAGNFEQSQAEELIGKYCLQIPAKKTDSAFEPFSFGPNPKREKLLKIKKEVEQTHVVTGGIGIRRDDPRRFALQVANTMLSGGFGSRLFQVIRDELGLAYYVYSRIMNFAETGVFQIGMGVDSKRVDEALAATNKQLHEIIDGNYTEAEFTRAKNYILGSLTTEIETSEDIASFYGMQELLQTEILTIEETRKRILGVSHADVHEICTEIFVPENFYTAILSRD